MPKSTYRKCPSCRDLCVTFDDVPGNYWVTKNRISGVTQFYFFTSDGAPMTCWLGVFNMSHRSIICESCDIKLRAFHEKKLRPLESSLTLPELLAKQK